MDHKDFLLNLNENLTLKSVNELKSEKFITELKENKIKFLAVVESIQGVLTNENVTVRQKGIEFLSWILSSVPENLFNGSEISVIVFFYCDCLKGHHNFLPATINGLAALVKMKETSKEEVLKVLVSLFQHVNCQAQLQPDRYNIYLLLKHIIENYNQEIKDMGPDLVYGVISFIEGESDPTCLLLVFNFLPFFIKTFDLGHLSEEMFELLSCYFPVDFNAAAKDNIKITREDLAEGLLQCLSVNNSFSEQSLLLIFEKLDSSFKTAKLDSYQLLRECCKTLKVESLSKHLNELWKSMVKDILPGNEKQVCEAGLLALSEVVGLLSEDEKHKPVLADFLDDISSSVKSVMNRVDENMFLPAIKVLVATSTKSKAATCRVLFQLVHLYSVEASRLPTEIKIVLSSLLPLLKCCQKHDVGHSKDSQILACYCQLMKLYVESTNCLDGEVRRQAFMGVLEIFLDLDQDLKKKLCDISIENVKAKQDIKTSDEFVQVWRRLALDHPKEFLKILSEAFSPDSESFMWALSVIADIPELTDFVVSIFLKVILESTEYVIGLDCLLNACKFALENSSNFFQIIHAQHNILERLIAWCINQSQREVNEIETLPKLAEIIALVVRHQPTGIQQEVVEKFAGMESFPSNGSGDCIRGFEAPHTVVILEAILGSVRQEVAIPRMVEIQEKLTNLALMSTNETVRLSSSRLLASFVNKSDDSLGSELLKKISQFENTDSRVTLNAAYLFSWVLKGVILKGSSVIDEWIPKWFELLGRKDVGEMISEGFRTVIEEDELYLNLKSYSNVRVLYRQRLFGNSFKLIKAYEKSEESVKSNYLLALVRLLQGIPIHLIQTEIAHIATILVRCLDVEKPDVLLTTLEILAVLLEKREKIFSDYIQNFVPRFLKLAKKENSMKIRINALKCLYSYGFYPTFVLLPIKNQIIRELQDCLDDKKRLVRKEAVRARCRWFLVGAPGEDILES